jgi:hypothetical protein
MNPLKHEVERMLAERRSFSAIEDRINRMPCTDDEKSALWLFAWNRQPLPVRELAIDDVLTFAARPRG